MIEVRQTGSFTAWFEGLRDRVARQRIVNRLDRVAAEHFGDHKWFGKIGELRIDHGPGYRLYYTLQGSTVVILLVGGDKQSQARDIARAEEMEAALD